MRMALQTMDLKVGESQDMSIWAFPKALEAVQDTLLGRIASNPNPVEFQISCVGAKPQVEVRLDMPDPAAGDAAVSADSKGAETKPVTSPPAPAKPAAVAAGKKGKDPEQPLTPRSKVASQLYTMLAASQHCPLIPCNCLSLGMAYDQWVCS